MCVVGYRFFDVIHWQNDVATVMLLTLLAEIPVVFWHTLPRPDKRDAALTLHSIRLGTGAELMWTSGVGIGLARQRQPRLTLPVPSG